LLAILHIKVLNAGTLAGLCHSCRRWWGDVFPSSFSSICPCPSQQGSGARFTKKFYDNLTI